MGSKDVRDVIDAEEPGWLDRFGPPVQKRTFGGEVRSIVRTYDTTVRTIGNPTPPPQPKAQGRVRP